MARSRGVGLGPAVTEPRYMVCYVETDATDPVWRSRFAEIGHNDGPMDVSEGPASCGQPRRAGALAAGLAGSGGSLVAVETDQGQKIGTVAGSAVLGAGAALFTVLAGISADNYTQQCTAGR